MDEHFDKAKEEFFSEAQEIIDEMSRDFLLLDSALQEGKDDPTVLNSVFRSVHTLKGLCSMFAEAEMNAVAYEMESVLDSLRMGRLQLDVRLLDQLFQGMEFLTQLLAQSHEHGTVEPSDKLEEFLHQLRKTAQAGSKHERGTGIAYRFDPNMLAVLTEYEEHRLRTALNEGKHLFQVHVTFELNNIDGGLDRLRQAVEPYGEILTYLPTTSAEETEGIPLDVLVASSADPSTLQQVLGDLVTSVNELPRMESSISAADPALTVPPVHGPSTAPSAAGQTAEQLVSNDQVAPFTSSAKSYNRTSWPAPASKPKPGHPTKTETQTSALDRTSGETSLRSISRTVRVDIRRLDLLMNQVGELRIVSTELEKLVTMAREQADNLLSRSLRQLHHLLERKLTVLQNGILDVRMVPLAQVFEKLERVARQAARETGKQVNLVITGADTEVDKLIGEELGDPLMHMIRNAVSHGIEEEQERRRVGKPLKGTVAVNAYHQGNQVVVEVEDDGKGIDPDHLLRVAVERKLIDKEEGQELSIQDKLALLFLPGLSTSQGNDGLSGRGVGMDVVKTNIGKLGGVVDVRSQVGIGTKFSITLPITLAMMRALLLRTRQSIFAVPLANIEEILPFDEARVELLEGRQVLAFHGESLPLCDLAETFRLDGPRDESQRQRIVVVSAATRRCGFVVDEIQDTRDIVLKPLTGALRSWPGFAGATELGNKQLGLVLDVPGLLEETLGSVVAVRSKEVEAV